MGFAITEGSLDFRRSVEVEAVASERTEEGRGAPGVPNIEDSRRWEAFAAVAGAAVGEVFVATRRFNY